MPHTVRTKRVYDPPSPADGRRVLVDRLWPRGLSRAAVALDAWAAELAPSKPLRSWFGHDPNRFSEFRARYRRELGEKRSGLIDLARTLARSPMTLLYAARDPEHNNAVVLGEVIEEIRRQETGGRTARTRALRTAPVLPARRPRRHRSVRPKPSRGRARRSGPAPKPPRHASDGGA